MTDDLSAPLGQGRRGAGRQPKKWTAAIPVMALQALAAALCCFALALIGWVLFAEGPLGGEPVAQAPVKLQVSAAASADQVLPASAQRPDGDPQHPNRYDGPPPVAGQPAGAPAAGNTVTIIDGSNGKRQEVVIPGRQADGGDARLTEPSRTGPLPRVAQDGTRPAEAYAQPVKPIPDRPNAPRIAIVLTGLGISAIGTSDALAKLPGAITFAFAPYGADLDHLAARAREGGHELLLQVPMEPFDYPDNDPGPQTLLTSLSSAQNIDRLHWLMGRLQGYVGLANYMGGRFTATEQALAPVLREAAKRGLIYVEDANSPRSQAVQIAGANNLPFARADVAIDALPATAEIDRALARLEKIARDRGAAVGMANALPASIERIAAWAKSIESRGILLVPVTAVAARGKAS